MSTHIFIPVLGKRIRATILDACGAYPAPGTADSALATDGFVSVSLSSEVEDGTEITKRKADGSLCVNERMSSSFKRFNVEIEFCGVNPALLSIVSNVTPYEDYNGDIAGFTVAEGELTKRFALEVWTGLSGQACNAGDDEASGYILLPFVQAGVLGDIEITGEDAVTFTMTGGFTRGGNAWGSGPYKVVYNAGGTAAYLPTALDPLDHLLMMDTGLALPPSSGELIAMPAYAITTTTTTV